MGAPLARKARFGVALAVEDHRSDKYGEPTLSRLAKILRERSAGTRT
jgi:hypothetical protein